MPLYDGMKVVLKQHLETIENGGKPPVIAIGELTESQHNEINVHRAAEQLPPLESREVVYMGRHHYNSRVTEDGYLIHDMLQQIESGLSQDSVFKKNPKKPHGTVLVNPNPRADGYGNHVIDNAVLELTTRKPRAELFSVIPKGDTNKPKKQTP
jgi:hypothetical protein